MKMQAKALERQAKKSEQEINQLKKKVSFEISRGNQEGARLYCDMIVQRKAQYRNFILMSTKLEVAANDMKVQMGTGEAMKSLVKATNCMKDIAQYQDPAQVFKVFAEFNKSMENQYVSQEVMNKVFCPLRGEEESDMANELLQQAQMQYAYDQPDVSIPMAQRQMNTDSAIEKRLDELLPPLYLCLFNKIFTD